MHIPPQPGAQRGIPSLTVPAESPPYPTPKTPRAIRRLASQNPPPHPHPPPPRVPAEPPAYPTPKTARAIRRFASQNPPPSPQPEAKQALIPTQEIPSTLRFCVTTPPAPAAAKPARPVATVATPTQP